MKNQEQRLETNEAAQEKYLLDQYENPQTIEINGENIKVVDVSPWNLKTEIPVYFAGGFTSSAEDAKEGIIRTAQAGRRVIAPFETHGVATDKEFEDLPNAE